MCVYVWGGDSILWFQQDEKQWDVTGMLIMSAADLVFATPGSRSAGGSQWEVTNQRFLFGGVDLRRILRFLLSPVPHCVNRYQL